MRKILLMVVAVLPVFVGGCAGALVGNNEQPKQNQPSQQRSVEQITADGNITSEIKARYANNNVLRQLNVLTYRGVVTLFGDVPTRSTMEKAISIARSVKGVTKVKSSLQLR